MNAPVEREEMEVDVLYVGAGPATLASGALMAFGLAVFLAFRSYLLRGID